VEQLRAEGVDVHLDLIAGVSHGEAQRRIAAADLLVDQLGLGWYGGVSLEAMSMGRPVVCHIDEAMNPFGSRLPVIRATRGDLTEVLRRLVAARDERVAAAVAGRAFALEHHDPRAVVRRAYAGLLPIPADRSD
jgi:hypothetical protein